MNSFRLFPLIAARVAAGLEVSARYYGAAGWLAPRAVARSQRI